MRRTPRTLYTLVFLCWLLLCHEAHGRSAAIAGGADAFQEHADAALGDYQAGRYEDAIAHLQAAYAIHPDPRLLLNLGHAWRRLGRPDEALRNYQRYRQQMPLMLPPATEEERATVEQYIALCGMQLSDPRPPPDPDVPDPPRQKTHDPPRVEMPSVPRPVAVPARRAVLLPAPRPPPPPLYRRGWFWGVVIGSVAAGAVLAGVLSAHPWDTGLPANIPIHDARF